MIKFNKFINKIGIEFEGFWSNDAPVNISNLFNSGHSDGSISNNPNSDRYFASEITTVPCNQEMINEVFDHMKKMEENRQYVINYSCGLHYHISFNNEAYGLVCNRKFYDMYVEMVKKEFPEVFAERAENSYCLAKLESNVRQFRRQSESKYRFINYQYNSFRTAEFRAFGGSKANMSSLEKCIQKTIDLVASYAKQKKSHLILKSEVELLDKAPMVLQFDIPTKKSKEYNFSLSKFEGINLNNVVVDLYKEKKILIKPSWVKIKKDLSYTIDESSVLSWEIAELKEKRAVLTGHASVLRLAGSPSSNKDYAALSDELNSISSIIEKKNERMYQLAGILTKQKARDFTRRTIKVVAGETEPVVDIQETLVKDPESNGSTNIELSGKLTNEIVIEMIKKMKPKKLGEDGFFGEELIPKWYPQKVTDNYWTQVAENLNEITDPAVQVNEQSITSHYVVNSVLT